MRPLHARPSSSGAHAADSITPSQVPNRPGASASHIVRCSPAPGTPVVRQRMMTLQAARDDAPSTHTRGQMLATTCILALHCLAVRHAVSSNALMVCWRAVRKFRAEVLRQYRRSTRVPTLRTDKSGTKLRQTKAGGSGQLARIFLPGISVALTPFAIGP